MDSESSAQHHKPAQPAPHVYQVAELTKQIKAILEGSMGTVWVEGEISNFSRSPSGHVYFTLKDAASQLRAVLFKYAYQTVTVPLGDGKKIWARGKIRVYEASGSYQLYVEAVKLAGEGDLNARFEELKQKLAKEGLFDEAHKKPLPHLPVTIGIVTSPTGAAIRDILKVLGRRFAARHILLAPVKVQGTGAADEIAAAIDYLNRHALVDVMIVGRGGGSLEDLWAFNEEIVVRAIFRSTIPVISAVGHEPDVALSDYVADRRAPTPSAAAEIVIPTKTELEQRVGELARRLNRGGFHSLDRLRHRIDQLASTSLLRDPRQWLSTKAQKVDLLAMRLQKCLSGVPHRIRRDVESRFSKMKSALDFRLQKDRHTIQQLEMRLNRGGFHSLDRLRHRIDQLASTSLLRDPRQWLSTKAQKVDLLAMRLQKCLSGVPHRIRRDVESRSSKMKSALEFRLQKDRHTVQQLEMRLNMLNPKAILNRGYTLTRTADGRILRSPAHIQPGDTLLTEWAAGHLQSIVQSTQTETGAHTHDNPKHEPRTHLRTGRSTPGKTGHRDGQRESGTRQDDSSLRGGPDTGQTLLF